MKIVQLEYQNQLWFALIRNQGMRSSLLASIKEYDVLHIKPYAFEEENLRLPSLVRRRGKMIRNGIAIGEIWSVKWRTDLFVIFFLFSSTRQPYRAGLYANVCSFWQAYSVLEKLPRSQVFVPNGPSKTKSFPTNMRLEETRVLYWRMQVTLSLW